MKTLPLHNPAQKPSWEVSFDRLGPTKQALETSSNLFFGLYVIVYTHTNPAVYAQNKTRGAAFGGS